MKKPTFKHAEKCIRSFLSILMFLSITSCSDDKAPKPGFVIDNIAAENSYQISKNREIQLPGNGFQIGDMIRLTDTGISHNTYWIEPDIDNEKAVFILPNNFIESEYYISIIRGNSEFTYGQARFYIEYMPLKILSFNIRVDQQADGDNRWENRAKAVTSMMKDIAPTVIGFQEVQPHQLTYLAKTHPEYAWYGIGRDTGNVPPETDSYNPEECMAIFYRRDELKLIDKGTFWLSETPEIPSKGWDAAYPRTCTWCLFESQKQPGIRFLHFNTHLDNKGSEARAESMKLIEQQIKTINTEGLPTLLTADFNSDVSSSIFSGIKRFMSEARAQAPVSDNKPSYNGYGNSSGSIIDHIFTTQDIVLERFKTIDANYENIPYISDHYPLCVEAKIL